MDRPRRCVAGHLYRPGEGFSEGWVVHDGARILDAGTGAPPERPVATGVVLPTPVNAHTHVGDAAGRGIDFRHLTLAQVVAPPDGLKHRLLRDTPLPERFDAMRRAVVEMATHGVRRFVDFREQGADGARLLREAAADLALEPLVLGRPHARWDDKEAEEVLQVADGLGLSGLGDAPDDVPERMAAAAHRARKMFALHLSEGRHEDAARALDLRPDFLVHMVHATHDDLAAVATAGVPVVLCPRSNHLFGALPDAHAMLEAGVTIALGSDNAMFHSMDPLEDARLLRKHDARLDDDALLEALIVGGRRVAREALPRDPFAPGGRADLAVYEATPGTLLELPARVLHATTQVTP